MPDSGDKIKQYEILRMLGKGGMGEVYLAHDSVLDREVAIKFLSESVQEDNAAQGRFLREAKSAAALDHPFICKIYETGEVDGKAFIVMEYLEGEELGEKLKKEPLSFREALRVVLEIAEALETAHGKNVVHRDLKPSNIMLTPQGHVKVMDFGLAKQILPGSDESVTTTLTHALITEHGFIVGTLAYMSPEQARGEKVDARSDIFSLGIILYELTSGKHPFSKSTPIETLSSILKDDTPPVNIKPKMANPVLSPILRKALAKDAGDRYEKAADLAVDIRKLQRETAAGSWLSFRSRPVFIGSILIVAMLLIGVWWMARRPTVSLLESGPEPISVLICDFQNQTGDPVFDGALEPLLRISLENASFISIYERGGARELAKQRDPSSDGRLSAQMAQLICTREGISVFIDGSIESSKKGYSVKVWAMDPVKSGKIAEAFRTIRTKAEVGKAADYLSAKLRSELGDTPTESARAFAGETFTASSIEAMKAYAKGQEFKAQGNRDEAIKWYNKALDHDPNLGRAYAGLAVTYYALRDYSNTEKNYKKALDLIAQMPDLMTGREKYRTRGGYYLFKQNYKRAIEEYSELVKQFPKDQAGYTNLALSYFMGYKMSEAFQEGLRAVELDPENLDYRYNQSWYALASGDFERAKLEARKTLEIEPSYAKAFVVLALTELAQDRPSEATKIYRQLETLSELGATFAVTGLADITVYEGRLEDAIAILKKGITFDLGKKWGRYFAADKYLMLAQAYLLWGKKVLAVDVANKALETYSGGEMLFAAAQIYIEAGQEDKARKIAGELDRKVQDIHLAYAKLIGGYLSLKRGAATNALKLFDEAQALVDTCLGRFALGRAYLEAEAFNEAYSEFEKCEKRRGEAMSIFLNDLPSFRYLDSLYYYIGRAQEGLGSPAAKDSYQKFLKIKANADKGDPLVEDCLRRLSLF